MHAWPYALRMIWMATWLSIVIGLVGSLIWFFWTPSQSHSELNERRRSELKKTKTAA